jgi:hypothetical protein
MAHAIIALVDAVQQVIRRVTGGQAARLDRIDGYFRGFFSAARRTSFPRRGWPTRSRV